MTRGACAQHWRLPTSSASWSWRGGDDQRTSFSASLASSSSASLMAPGNIAPDPLLWMSLSSMHWVKGIGVPLTGLLGLLRRHMLTSNAPTWTPSESATCIHFQPVVLEAQGGFHKDAAAIVHGIAIEAAAVLRRDPASVKQEIMNKLAVVLCRPAARSIDRRRRAHRRLEARPIQLAPAPHAE